MQLLKFNIKKESTEVTRVGGIMGEAQQTEDEFSGQCNKREDD